MDSIITAAESLIVLALLLLAFLAVGEWL